MLDMEPALARCALGTFLRDLFFCLCLIFNIFLETDVCSVEVVNLEEDAIERISSVSSYNEDSTSEDNIEDVSVVVVIAPIGFKPIVRKLDFVTFQFHHRQIFNMTLTRMSRISLVATDQEIFGLRLLVCQMSD